MVWPCLRRAATFLTALALPCLAMLPPEHLHADSHGEHEGTEVHRHFEPHHPVTDVPVVPVEPSVEGQEDATVYLTDVYLGSDTASMAGPDATPCPIDPLEVAVSRPRGRIHPARDLRVHDPPWARSRFLRGPPLPSALA